MAPRVPSDMLSHIIQVAYAIPPTPRRSESVRRSWKLPTGLRPIPPLCLGGGSEAS